jgi:hypothetical protein
MPDTPEPIYSPGVKRPDPLTRFVNRDRELNIVVETLLNLSLDRASQILTFHGVGGQGKSLLCRKIKEAIRSDPTFEDVRLAFVNLEHHPEREPIFLLVWLRNALMEAGGVRLLSPSIWRSRPTGRRRARERRFRRSTLHGRNGLQTFSARAWATPPPMPSSTGQGSYSTKQPRAFPSWAPS